jgi:hypothetical protein
MDMEGRPDSPYAKHFPNYLEFSIDHSECEPDDINKLTSIIVNHSKEIVNLLSCLTNHRFFIYDISVCGWGIVFPRVKYDELSLDEKNKYDEMESDWFLGNYSYHNKKEDQTIYKLTDFSMNAILVENRKHEYFSNNPIDDDLHELKFPNTLNSALDFYYQLSDKTRLKVNSCIYLACDGMDIAPTKRSLAFLSYVSALEGLVNLEVNDDEIEFECASCKAIKSSPYYCPSCSRPIWGIKQKFIVFLSKFVAGSDKSKKIYSEIYNLRSKMTHTSQLFVGDYEMSFDIDRNKKEYEDWLMRLETLQLVRISLDSWLRYPSKMSK